MLARVGRSTLLLVGLAVAASHAARAQVVRDGTLGPGKDIQPSGPAYLISPALGETHGPNLFHSFESFSLRDTAAGRESAHFEAGTGVQNILARVTGGHESDIDGKLGADANLYLMNPAGIVFGPNASVDVKGSFHATTADSVRLGEGGRFNADPARVNVLTVDPPVAFGFLHAPGAASRIEMDGTLQVGDMASHRLSGASPDLSLTAGSVRVDGGELDSGGGRIDLVAVASPGEVVAGHAATLPDASGFAELGKVEIRSGQLWTTGAGSVAIRGSEVLETNASTLLAISDDRDGGTIDIAARDRIQIEGSMVRSRADGEGRSAAVNVEAPRVEVRGVDGGAEGLINSAADDGSDRRLGPITVRASESVELSIREASGVGIRTPEPGALAPAAKSLSSPPDLLVDDAQIGTRFSGSTTIDAARIRLLHGGGIENAEGEIFVNATDSILLSGYTESAHPSRILTTSSPSGRGGDIFIRTPSLSIERAATVATESDDDSTGRSGDIHIDADRIAMSQEGQIYTKTHTREAAGDIDVAARDGIDIRGTDVTGPIFGDRVTGISSQSLSSSGEAGAVHVSTPMLTLREGAGVGSVTMVQGPGGRVTIDKARRVEVSGGSAIDTSTFLFGPGGSIDIDASESVSIVGHDSQGRPSHVGSTAFSFARAGDVSIHAPEVLLDGGIVSTATLGLGHAAIQQANGGSIQMSQLTRIIGAWLGLDFGPASTYVDGAAGNILIGADRLTLRNGAKIDSSSYSDGTAGFVELHVRDALDVSGSQTAVTSRTAGSGSARGLSIDAGSLFVRDGARLSIDSRPTQVDVPQFLAALGAPFYVALDQVDETLKAIGFEFPHLSADLLAQILDTRRDDASPNAGNLTIRTGRLLVDRGSISAGALNSTGGNIQIDADSFVKILRGGTIDASVTSGTGGNIDITARDLVELRDGSITTSVVDGQGGNISIDPTFLLLEGGSRIVSQAGKGRAATFTS